MHETIDLDVIVVGAGLSGLTAAYTLLEKAPSLRVLVLESSERTGGRLLAIPLLSKNGLSCYDLGGGLIASSHTFLLELLEKLDLKPIPYLKTKGHIIIEKKNGAICKTVRPFEICNLWDRIQLFRLFLKLEELCEKVSFRDPFKQTRLDRVTLEKFLKRWFLTGKARNILRSVVLASCGVKTTQMSALFYLAFLNSMRGLEFLGNEDLFFVEGGSEEMCVRLHRKISGNDTVLCKEAVEEIEEYNGGVVVETTNNVYHCVVMAIPPSQVKKIKFYPRLRHERVFHNILEGSLVKFVVTYDKQFWIENGFSGDVLNCNGKRPILMCRDVTIKGRPALSGLISSADRVKLNLREKVLIQLAKYFGKDALQPLSYYEEVWSETGSPMCCLGPKKVVDFSGIFSTNGRIFWASAEITDYYYGHMEGAVQAGFRAAIEVLYKYRPSAIGIRDVIKMRPKLKPHFRYKNTYKALLFRKKVLLPMILLLTYIAIKKCNYRLTISIKR